MKEQSRTRTNLRSLVLALAVFIGFGTHASAQAYVVTNYSLDQLNNEPGALVLSPNYLTLLEFPDLIETVATGRADLIQVEVDDNRILLRPTRGNGRTDLIVKVAGVNAMFRVDIEGDNGTPRRYVIGATQAAQPEQPNPAPTPAPEGNGRVATMPLHEQGIGTTPVAGEAQHVAQQQPNPFDFTYSARINESGRLTVYYTLANKSGNPIANDGSRITLADDMGELEFNIVRMNPDGTPNRLQPGYEENGVLTAERSLFGQARIEWPIVEQGPGKTYVINELVVDIEHE